MMSCQKCLAQKVTMLVWTTIIEMQNILDFVPATAGLCSIWRHGTVKTLRKYLMGFVPATAGRFKILKLYWAGYRR